MKIAADYFQLLSSKIKLSKLNHTKPTEIKSTILTKQLNPESHQLMS